MKLKNIMGEAPNSHGQGRSPCRLQARQPGRRRQRHFAFGDRLCRRRGRPGLRPGPWPLRVLFLGCFAIFFLALACLPALAAETYERLSPAEGNLLIDYAKGSIAKELGLQPNFSPATPAKELKGLWQRRGVFVTLQEHGQLRGCIGAHESSLPLWQQVCETAKDSAFHDPRFRPVAADEFKDLEFEVSAYLTPVTKISGPGEFVVGKHGVIMRLGGRGATFLPHVPTEQGWDKNQTLEELCLKAGLPPGSWKSPDAEFHVYTTQIIKEVKKN